MMSSLPAAPSAAKLRLLDALDNARIKRVLGECKTLVCSEGMVLLRPGEANESVYLVTEGELRIRLGEGEFGIGRLALSLEPKVDYPENATLFNAVFAQENSPIRRNSNANCTRSTLTIG